jgi:cytochrome c oxidase assembly protein subunit 15
LALVYVARGDDRYRRLAWVTVFFTFDLIVFGAFTRLTDSGWVVPIGPVATVRPTLS